MTDTDTRGTLNGDQVLVQHNAKGSLALLRLAAVKFYIRSGNVSDLPSDPDFTSGMESTQRNYPVTMRLHDRDEFQRYAELARYIDEGIPSGPLAPDTGNASDDGSEPVNADGSDMPAEGDSADNDPKGDGPTDSI
jgi:hypothetical protein